MIHMVVCTLKKKKKKKTVQLDLSSPESSSLCDSGFDLAQSGIFLRFERQNDAVAVILKVIMVRCNNGQTLKYQ